MATSGTYSLAPNFNDIVEEALDILQVGADGETLSPDYQKRCRKTANFMLAAWAGQGGHLWTQEEGTLFLVVGQGKYDFSTANLANTWHETTLSSDEAAAQVTLSVTSTANMTVADIIGIVLDTKDIHWTTIVSKTSSEVVIATALPSVAASGAKVRNYIASSFIPVHRVKDVRRRESASYEIPVNFESRKDYFNLPDKESTGSPIQAYFSRQQPPGFMYIWPPPSDANIAMNFTYERPIQIIDAGENTLDLPEYWHEALIYNLAKRMILKLGCSVARAQMIREEAKASLDQALLNDSELYPIRMVMRNA